MGGTDTIRGIGYQSAYTLSRLLELLGENSRTQTISVEGSGEDVEDLTIAYAGGTEEAIQVKKRDTREGPYGLWGLADVKPIVAALYALSRSGRNITTFRFVATGSAHTRVIAIQKACHRLREGTFTQKQAGGAVADIRAMIDAGEEQARDFMRRLWLDVPLDSEPYFEQSVQNYLMRVCGVPPGAVVRVYNDLYKRVLDKGKEAKPASRAITREELLLWLEEPRDPGLQESARIEIRQRVRELRGRLVGVEVGQMTQGAVQVVQELGTVDGQAVGAEAGKMKGGSVTVDMNIDVLGAGGTATGIRLDRVGGDHIAGDKVGRDTINIYGSGNKIVLASGDDDTSRSAAPVEERIRPSLALPQAVEANQTFDIAAIRERLGATFDDSGLDAFCMDFFPKVYDRFSRGMRKDEKITLLLDECRRSPAQRQELVTRLQERG